jgi:transcriptional regulator with PAS, ATPase and Fis domain
MLLMSDGPTIEPAHLPDKVRRSSRSASSITGGTLKERVAGFERRVLKTELRRANYNISAVSRALELDRSTLYQKMEKYGLTRRETRS